VGCSEEVSIFLQHAAAPFVFSAALCPTSVAATREGLRILAKEPERVHRLKRNADFLREGLRSLGYDVGLSETPVIPVIFNSDEKTALFARALRDYNVLVAPVLFPAVPQDTARLRLCVTAAHTENDLDFALDAFAKLARN
jgi:7-keto-8-aminopelargonate synthetase-like enzyme